MTATSGALPLGRPLGRTDASERRGPWPSIPDEPELLFQAGNVYADLDRWAPARLALERLVNCEDGERGGTVDNRAPHLPRAD
jgi:hypothetical protein